MREWFIVGCKLLGVYFLYWALATIISSLGFYATTSASTFSNGPSRTEMLLTSAFSIVSEIGFAIPLLFKTDWIADVLKLRGRIEVSVGHNSAAVLQLGITLLGIYIFCTKLGYLAKICAVSLRENNISDPFAAVQPKGLAFSIEFIDPVITIVISLLLIFGAKYIAAFLIKRNVRDVRP